MTKRDAETIAGLQRRVDRLQSDRDAGVWELRRRIEELEAENKALHEELTALTSAYR